MHYRCGGRKKSKKKTENKQTNKNKKNKLQNIYASAPPSGGGCVNKGALEMGARRGQDRVTESSR